MVRETSIAAFNAIKENGLLSKRRFQVYDFVFHNGPVTARQVTKALLRQGENSGNFATRLSELRTAGVVREVGKVLDPETGMSVLSWDVTAKLPVKFDKPVEHKCPTCKGTGKITHTQGRLF